MSNPKRKAASPGQQGQSYWLYGLHPVRAALINPDRRVRRLCITQGALERLGSQWEQRKLRPELLSSADITRMLPEGAVHQGVALEVQPLASPTLEEFLSQQAQKQTLVVLDQVTDPHNVGAILRSCAAFGAGAVILPRDHAPQESAVLAKASSGGIECVPLIPVTNLAQALETLKKNGYWCAGLDGEAKQTLAQAKLKVATALVLGAEGAGLRRLTSERCDLLVRLPILPQMESLNVSNAAAVALYALAQMQ